ncbi:isoprenyl transferase [Persicimonas caeni]|uniref:Isoprenyl transferase n=1 Tax=Persicimonas caeni TaxID=2292766 RepID=A0A4Y6PTS9_PERCE|nr:isoprenyl transferase [Persicimonas caeni]QDG51643.1 isoprenyl transferase [Persicimonas caeni]QED32864.1 isoprenyl transferase [Persicimonas caeni]
MPKNSPKPARSTGELSDLTVDELLLSDYEGPIPTHVAVIMDGNGRWAQQRGMRRIKGHRQGAHSVRRVVEACRYLGVEALTLYAFSTQNWGRPEDEVTGLMTLFDLYIKKERERLMRNGVRIQVIGQRSQLGRRLRKSITDLEEATADNRDLLLQVAVSYGGREEILQAARNLAKAAVDGALAPDDITEATFEEQLYTSGAPDPDLVIRTSGELRISNFLLWQIAYSELYVTDVLWPDFDEAQLLRAFDSFGGRERRFGKTREQIKQSD